MLNGFFRVGPMVFRGCHVKITREIKVLEGFFGFPCANQLHWYKNPQLQVLQM